MMRAHTRIANIVLVAGLLAALSAAPTITPWSRGRTGAFSLTFDDQIAGQFTVGVPAMNQRGIRGSIYISSVDANVKTAAAGGHEIGSHTWNHWCFDDPLVTSQVVNEFSTHTTHINSQISQQKCATLAWPCGGAAATARTIAKGYFIACRNLGSNLETAPVAQNPVDMYQIPSWTGCNPDFQGTKNGYISSAVKTTLQAGGWMVFTYHGVGSSTDGYNDVTAATFGMELDTLKAHESTLWTAPFGEVARYIWERKYGKVTQVSATASQETYRLTNSLDSVFSGATFKADTIFAYPLTLTMPLPTGWTGATVKQNGQTMWSQVSGGTSKTLLFEAVPERGDIVISSGNTVVMDRIQPRIAGGSTLTRNTRMVDLRGRSTSTATAMSMGVYLVVKSRTSLSLPRVR